MTTLSRGATAGTRIVHKFKFTSFWVPWCQMLLFSLAIIVVQNATQNSALLNRTSVETAYPEACYRLISALSKHPELFWAMPARRSQTDNPGVMAQGPDKHGIL
jgi:hypothetical protein